MSNHRTLEGQLVPLKQRTSPHQQEKRSERNEYRSNLAKQHAITRGAAVTVLQTLQRGFFGRLKWLLLGR